MFIFSNLAVSVDGKIATATRIHFPIGTSEDRRHMQVLRRKADAVLMGAASLRAFRKPCLIRNSKRQILNVIISSGLERVSPDWEFFKDPRVKRLLFIARKPSARRLALFEKTSAVVFLRPGRSIARQITATLEKRGIRKLLVEGGGSVMWDFVSEDLINEYHVTLTPKIIGGARSPTMVDGKGFEPGQILKLKLTMCRRIGDELYLVYKSVAD